MKTLIDIQRFLDANMSAMPENIFLKLMNAQMRGATTIELEDSVILRIETKRLKEQEATSRLYECAERNNVGIELESKGKFDEAIKVYEENVANGCSATHSFDRLMVLYRKAKDYKNEIRVIKRAIRVFKKVIRLIEKYTKRLEKAELLLHKSKL